MAVLHACDYRCVLYSESMQSIDHKRQSLTDQEHEAQDLDDKRMQAKLASLDIRAEVQEQFAYGFSHAAIGRMVTDILGRLVDVNACFCQMLGRDKAQLMAEGALLKLLHEHDQAKARRWGDEAQHEGRDDFDVEMRYLHSDGRWITCAVTSHAVRDAEGDVLYFFTQANDITTLKKAQQDLADRARQLEEANSQLVQADQMKTRFLAMTTHDLRNPLTVIQGFARVLQEHKSLSEQDRNKYLEVICAQTARLDRMMEDLLVVSKLDSGALRPHPQSVPAVAFAQRVVQEMQTDEDIVVTGSEDICALADPEHLERVIVNLVGNALKYGAPTYEIAVTRAGEQVVIRVCDRGSGVPEDFVADLFEPFSRASKAIQSDAKGTGLGLMIVKGLSEAAGGSLSYHREGDRTCFCVRLPQSA